MKITTQNIYGIEIKETENGFCFASSACKLDFKPSGTLRGMTIGDLTLTERSDAKPVAITTGGNYRSTIDPTGKNKNWASLTGENMAHETPDVTLKNARLVRTMLTVELHLTLDCGKVEIEDIFALKQGEKGFTRRFIVTNRTNTNLTLRSLSLTLPSIPEGTNARPVGGFKPAIIETGKGTIAAWYDPRYDADNLDANLTYTTRVESDLAEGDSVSAPGFTLALVDGDKYEAAGYVRDRLEEKGLRAKNTNREKLTSLTCYEVEIGPLRLSETRCHHRYDHPSELAADLERIHSLGFNFKPLPSGDGILIEGVPPDTVPDAAGDMLLSFAEQIISGTGSVSISRELKLERALYQMSCKAAIKAGHDEDISHIRWICDRLLALDCIKFCPHGRPVAFEMTKNQIEKRFGRE